MFRMRWFLLLFSLTAVLHGQTSRGGISGTVVDSQGAVVPNAPVVLTNPDTGAVLNSKSNSSGEFSFPELQPDVYQISVSLAGFQTKKINEINVEVSKVVPIKVELTIGSESTVVDVQAEGVQVETASSSLVSVVDAKSVQDMPMNGRDFTKMIRFNAGVVGSGYSNGNSSVNYQVDGVDNVDAWLGAVASNQGGIAGVPGGLIPIEAIDQFSIQSQGEADMGRNAGSNQNMVMKSGTNSIHGDLFFYNRNEYFAAITPVSPVGSRKAPIRNNQFGFTLGGPVMIPHLYNGKNKTFLFFAGEIQLASAGNTQSGTVLNDAWVGSAAQNGGTPSVAAKFNAFYGLNTQNPVTAGLYTTIFRTAANPNTGAVQNNYFSTASNQYNSYNGVIKLDHSFTDREKIAIRYIGTTGKQTAYRGSLYKEFYQTAPMHIHNFSVIQTSILSPNLLNQLTLGTNYFLQTFNDANQNYNPAVNAGLNVGATGIIAAGSPSVSFASGTFTNIGQTQPSGRTDVTGQINDSVRWTVGKHSFKFGGEYRHSNVYSISLGSSRGTFSFNGTGGPWSGSSVGFTPTVTPDCIVTDPQLAPGASTPALSLSQRVSQCAAIHCYAIGGQSFLTQSAPQSGALQQARGETCLSHVLSAADFYLGQTPSTTGSSSLRVGNGTRIYTINQEDFWVNDSYKATPKLTLNYGVRWSLPGVVNDNTNDLYSFVPTGPNSGAYKQPTYFQYYSAFAPRLGFAFSPFSSNRTALRGAWGLIYNVPSMSSMAAGTAGNPAGPNPSYVGTINSFNMQTGVNAFAAAKAPSVLPAVGVNQNYRISYQANYSLNIEQQVASNTLFTIGYIGSQGRRLQVTNDLNQATGCTNTSCSQAACTGTTCSAPGCTSTLCFGYVRPYDTANGGLRSNGGIFFDGQVVAAASPFTTISQLNSGGISNYNSLNLSLRQANWKGLTATANYIWAKRMDDGSGPVTQRPSTSPYCVNCVGGVFPDGVAGPGIKMDYGVGSGDTRQTVNGFVSYDLPKSHFVPKLTSGWQVNGLFSFYTGGALNPTIGGTSYSLQGQSGDRPNSIQGVSPYLTKAVSTTPTGARVYTTINRAAFDYPISSQTTPNYNPPANLVPTGVTGLSGTNTFGVYGNMRRNSLTSTAFGDMDFSLFKETPVTEKIKTQLRAEVFNIFNQSNLSGPGVALSSGSTFGQITSTAQASSNPGMGYGEPFNVQFAFKILF